MSGLRLFRKNVYVNVYDGYTEGGYSKYFDIRVIALYLRPQGAITSNVLASGSTPF
jgi:hypothetical protein